MTPKLTTSVLIATMMFAAPALALDVFNNDEASHTVEIIAEDGEGSSETIELGTGQNLLGVCLKGCIIRLNNNAEHEFTGEETISIEDEEFVLVD